MACRGEYEPASFVIETEKALEAVHVDTTPLRGRRATIPASTIDIRVALPVYRRVTDLPVTLNWLLIHDPNLLLLKDEPWPDEPAGRYTKTHYFTREPVDSSEPQPADVARRQQFWVTVHVPNDAAAGQYTTTLTITAANARPRKVRLELTVPPFDLSPPPFEYSVYYPAYLEGGEIAKDNAGGYIVLTPQQYLAELRNMAAHGCLNPSIYNGPVLKNGALDFTTLGRILDLREQAGMKEDTLYLVSAGPVETSGALDPAKKESNTRWTRQIVEWAKQRGYPNVYFMGHDEAAGEQLTQQRNAWESIHQGGAKVFAATGPDFYGLVDDVMDLPVVLHPMQVQLDKFSMMPADQFLGMPDEVRQAIDPRRLCEPGYRAMIEGVHRHGFKIYTYMDPLGGYTIPETHRRMRGLGLWKSGLDGTMTWAYTHIVRNQFVSPGPVRLHALFDFVLRGKEATFDTLGWEAYREGYDDARYLATLQQALQRAESTGKKAKLVRETRAWLDQVSLDTDMDAWRQEMARRIEQLSK